MKSTKQQKPIKKPVEYPILMEHEDKTFVVLFCSLKKGTVVYCCDESYKVGHYSNGWNDATSNSWHPFQGSITLSN